MDDSDAPGRLGLHLRRLRRTAGLSQRQMASRLGLSAHSAVSDYESGRRLPAADILAAYERALALPEGELAAYRRRDLSRRADEEFRTAAAAAPVSEPNPVSEPASRPAGVHIVVPRSLAAALVIGVVTLVTLGGAQPGRSAPSSQPVWAATNQHVSDRAERPAPENMDGDDPRARGCALDAVTIAEVPLLLPGELPFGTLRLRHSVLCGTSWGSASYENPDLFTVRIAAHRDVDHAQVRSEWSNNTPPGSYGDMLSTATGCVWVEAVVVTPDGAATPARTPCEQ